MILGVTFAVIYGAIAAVAMVMTLVEQRRREKGLLLCLAGFLLCVIWPVTMLGMLAVIHWRKTPSPPRGPDAMARVATVKLG